MLWAHSKSRRTRKASQSIRKKVVGSPELTEQKDTARLANSLLVSSGNRKKGSDKGEEEKPPVKEESRDEK